MPDIMQLWGELDVMQKIWEWVKERQTTEEIKNEILLNTEMREWTPGIMQHLGAN